MFRTRLHVKSGQNPQLFTALALVVASAVGLVPVARPTTAEAASRKSSDNKAAKADFTPGVFQRVEEFRLDNGMLFLLLPRHDVPTVAGRIRFRVGNVDSPAGRSGVAHMFEHMAFQGTDAIGAGDPQQERAVEDSVRAVGLALSTELVKHDRADTARVHQLQAELGRLNERQAEVTVPNEFPRLYDQYTYNFNAWTSPDFTEYQTDVPANALEVWMLMESERIQHPSFRGFYRERDVVMEERHESEDSPTDMAWELLGATVWQAHPYQLPVIGYMSDLQTLTLQDAEAFRSTYYVPGNAVCSLWATSIPRKQSGSFNPTSGISRPESRLRR